MTNLIFFCSHQTMMFGSTYFWSMIFEIFKLIFNKKENFKYLWSFDLWFIVEVMKNCDFLGVFVLIISTDGVNKNKTGGDMNC